MTRICFVVRQGSGASELLSAVAAEARSLGADVEIAGRGTVAERFALGYAAAWDRWGNDSESERTMDVLFTGSPTDRRQSALAASAEFLTRFRFCVATDPSPLHAKARLEQLRESHVVLAIHRDARPYFDWLLAIRAICNGAVLISEHACDFGPLVPSEHFVSARADDLGLLAAQMLRNERQMSEMRRNAYEFVRRELTMRRSVERLLGIADELCARPARARSFRVKRGRRRALAPSLPCGDSRLAAPSSPPLEPVVPRPAQGAASGPPESDAQLRFLRATPVYWQAGTELSVCIAPCEDALEAVAALEHRRLGGSPSGGPARGRSSHRGPVGAARGVAPQSPVASRAPARANRITRPGTSRVAGPRPVEVCVDDGGTGRAVSTGAGAPAIGA